MEKVKKYSLLKVIGIAFLIYAVLTWFISTGNFSDGQFVKGETNPLGLYGIFTAPVYGFAVFAQYFVLVLCIGGFYGVLNKTGVYQKIVSFFASKDKTKILIGTILIFSLVTSVLGETIMVFILLPFFIAVLLKMGYDRLSSLAATVGGGLIGFCASICGNMAIYKNYFRLEPKAFIIFNIIILLIFVFLLSLFIINRNSKKSVKPEEIPLFEVVKNNKKSCVPLIIILVIMLLLLLLGLFNWFYAFDFKLFADIHEKIVSFQLFNTNIVGKIFGEFSEIGYFSNYDVCAILLVSSFIISWIYSIKFDEFIDSFKEGSKKVLLPGLYVVFASLIFSQIAISNSGNISITISNFILNWFNDFNILTGSLSGIVSSFFYNDYLYMMNGLYGMVSIYNTSMMPFILSVFQSMFGVMMFILPVSITLVGGLKYLDISYKDWIKYIWKFLLQIFIISIIGCIILSMIV